MYYSVKVNWLMPKENTDEMQKQSKSFLVFAESCTEAEGKMVSWIPANYQDPVVTDVKKTNIGEIRVKGDSEEMWLVKIADDMDGRAEKPTIFNVVYNANHLEEAVRKCGADTSGEIISVTQFKTIVDLDLVSEDVTIKRKVVTVDKED